MLRKGKYPMEPWDLKVKTRMRKLPKGRKIQMIRLLLILFLSKIGWESNASFLN